MDIRADVKRRELYRIRREIRGERVARVEMGGRVTKTVKSEVRDVERMKEDSQGYLFRRKIGLGKVVLRPPLR